MKMNIVKMEKNKLSEIPYFLGNYCLDCYTLASKLLIHWNHIHNGRLGHQ